MQFPYTKILSFLIYLLLVLSFLNAPIETTSPKSVTLICVQKDGKFGFVDDKGKAIIPCEFDNRSSFSEGWVALQKGKNWAYYDGNGKKVLDLKKRFTYCGQFHDGMALVSTLPTKKAPYISRAMQKNICGELQFINTRGEVLFKIKNKWNLNCYSHHRNGFSDGLLKIVKEKDPKTGALNFGYLDKEGILKIPFNFRTESNAKSNFREGLAVVGKRTYLQNVKKPIIKYGFINKKGDWQIPPIYRHVHPFNKGAAFVSGNLLNQYHVINKEGNRIFPPDVESFPRKMRDSLIAVSKVKRTERNSEIMGTRRWAIAKTDGTMITDFKFANLDPGKTATDLWRVSLPEDNKSIGYVNDQGEMVIPYQYSRGSSIFENGLAVVRMKEKKNGLAVVRMKEKKNVYGVINTKGEWIMPPDANARYQNIGCGVITNNTIKELNFYNKTGETINFEGYVVSGVYQQVFLNN
jgi:hypothetical protein